MYESISMDSFNKYITYDKTSYFLKEKNLENSARLRKREIRKLYLYLLSLSSMFQTVLEPLKSYLKNYAM